MATKAKIGAGTQLQMGDGASPEVFTTVPEVRTLKFGGIKVDLLDVTNQDSPLQNGLIFKEYITGLAEGGDVDVTLNYLASDTTQGTFRSKQDGKAHNFKIVVRDITASPVTVLKTFSFAAYLTELTPDFETGKEQTLTIKLKITGNITEA